MTIKGVDLETKERENNQKEHSLRISYSYICEFGIDKIASSGILR